VRDERHDSAICGRLIAASSGSNDRVEVKREVLADYGARPQGQNLAEKLAKV
jgi:hypothetical protein